MPESQPPGVILADAAYTIAEFQRRMQLGNTAFRTVRAKLPIIEIGRRRYIIGADWIEFLRTCKKGKCD